MLNLVPQIGTWVMPKGGIPSKNIFIKEVILASWKHGALDQNGCQITFCKWWNVIEGSMIIVLNISLSRLKYVW